MDEDQSTVTDQVFEDDEHYVFPLSFSQQRIWFLDHAEKRPRDDSDQKQEENRRQLDPPGQPLAHETDGNDAANDDQVMSVHCRLPR